MDALVMCGGRGTRLDTETEKPLFAVGDKPMVAHIADALVKSRIETIHAVVSPQAPETREFVETGEFVKEQDSGEEYDSLDTIQTPGKGYVADLQVALEAVEPPVLTVAADLPLLEADAVNSVLDAYESPDPGSGSDSGSDPGSVTVCVPAALKRALGASADTTFEREQDSRELAPTGINVVAETDSETMYETYDARFAVNVNRTADADLAEELL